MSHVRHVPPVPAETQVVYEKTWRFTMEFLKWLRTLVHVVDSAFHVIGRTDGIEAKEADISATELNDPTKPLSEGVYRISWHIRVVQPATTSSAIEATFRWTSGGVAQEFTTPSLVTNLTTSVEFGTMMVAVDGDTNITYETDYTSVGATPMQYRLDLVLEAGA